MSFELKQCPRCGRWCHPQLVVADKYNTVTSNTIVYEVVYPCVCNKIPWWNHLSPISVTNVDEMEK